MCRAAIDQLRRSERDAILAPRRAPLSFARLLDHLDRMARRLRELGVHRHNVIASVLPDGPDAATAALAGCSAAAFAPLSPYARRADYESQFFELTPKLLLALPGAAPAAREAARRLRIPVADVIPAERAGEFTLAGVPAIYPAPERAALSSEIALILAVSESRFAPLTHANLRAAIESIADGPGCCLNRAPLHQWRGLVQGLMAPLAAGATIAFPGAECRPDRVCYPHGAQTEAPVICCNEVAFFEGDLAARGPAVIPGYFRNEAATRDAFRDGWFVITGRSESIRHGHILISPVEVDRALLLHPDVADAVTFPIPDPNFGESAAAAVVPRVGANLAPAELKRFVATHLPRHKGPQKIVLLDAIPRVKRAAMAHALGLDIAIARAEVFPIHPEGVGTPLFVVSPRIELPRQSRPIFGIREPAMHRLPPPRTVEHAAAECVRALRRFRPEGPYTLAGSALAREMARQLAQEREEVDLVLLPNARRRTWLRRLWDHAKGEDQPEQPEPRVRIFQTPSA